VEGDAGAVMKGAGVVVELGDDLCGCFMAGVGFVIEQEQVMREDLEAIESAGDRLGGLGIEIVEGQFGGDGIAVGKEEVAGEDLMSLGIGSGEAQGGGGQLIEVSVGLDLDSNAFIAFTVDMTTLTIRKLDEEIKSRLKIRAAINGHSMEQEARLILKQSLEESLSDTENGTKAMERWQGHWKNRLSSSEILEMTRGS